MATDIDNIITVQISRQTTTPSMASFDSILIVAEFLIADTTPNFTERVRQYGNLAAIVADGFASSSFVYRAASRVFAQNPAVNKVFIGRKLSGTDGSETWTQTMDAIALENNDWYGLVTGARLLADQELVATWAEANKKLYGTSTADADLIGSTYNPASILDIAAYAKSNALDRTFVFYHSLADTPASDVIIEAAMFGKAFPKDPGSITYSFKTLAGVPVDVLNTTQSDNAFSKEANTYQSISDVNLTRYGTVGSGEYIDVIHGIDWLAARIQQLVFTPIVQLDKVPFTDGGIDVVVSQLRAALQEGVVVGLLASFTITAPLVADVSATDKGNRLLPDVNFTAVLAGAIHKTQINGTVTL